MTLNDIRQAFKRLGLTVIKATWTQRLEHKVVDGYVTDYYEMHHLTVDVSEVDLALTDPLTTLELRSSCGGHYFKLQRSNITTQKLFTRMSFGSTPE